MPEVPTSRPDIQPTLWHRVILEKLTVAQLVSKFNLNVHYYVHWRPQLVPSSSEINPVHAFTQYLCMIHCNTLLSVRRSPTWSLVCRLMTKTLYAFLTFPICPT